MAPITVDGIEGLKEIVGQQIGPSEWREVTQDMINTFADVSGDHQWIHVDIERAKNESPFGGPIAHGNLTLSIIDGFREQLTEAKGFKLGVNYGWNKGRIPAPAPAGSNLRAQSEAIPAYAEVLSVDDVGGGWFQALKQFSVEIEGGEKPVCVAESEARFLP